MSNTFMYLCGIEPDGTDAEMPPAVVMFGQKFIQDVPKTITPEMYKTQREYDHAVYKLGINQHFRKMDDAVQEVIQPKKTWSRKAKPKIDVQDAIEVSDAAE